MSDRPWWSHVVQWGLWALVMFLVMGWLAKARRPVDVKGRAYVLTHPPTTLILGLVCTGFFLVVAVLAGIYAKPGERWTVSIFVFFVLLCASLIAEALRVRHELHSEGILYRGLLVRYDRVAWTEIESARWNSSMKWLVLRTRDGRALRFSAMLNGWPTLAFELNEHVPELEVDPGTRKLLADARAGILPSVWA